MIGAIAKFFGVSNVIVIVGLVALVLGGGLLGKCAYDASVIDRHETKKELKQVKRERKADAGLEQQKDHDVAAKQQRQQEMDNATKGIPDGAPSARQRAIACSELRREAKQRGKPEPAC